VRRRIAAAAAQRREESATIALPSTSLMRSVITSAYVVPSSSPKPGYGRMTSRLPLIVLV
jgi:hypothetical protein